MTVSETHYDSARGLGMAMPAEWAEHELTLMAWPARLELWEDGMAAAKAEYAAVARAVAAFEPVLMVAPPGARRRCATHAAPASRRSSCRSTTRGCETAGRSS